MRSSLASCTISASSSNGLPSSTSTTASHLQSFCRAVTLASSLTITKRTQACAECRCLHARPLYSLPLKGSEQGPETCGSRLCPIRADDDADQGRRSLAEAVAARCASLLLWKDQLSTTTQCKCQRQQTAYTGSSWLACHASWCLVCRTFMSILRWIQQSCSELNLQLPWVPTCCSSAVRPRGYVVQRSAVQCTPTLSQRLRLKPSCKLSPLPPDQQIMPCPEDSSAGSALRKLSVALYKADNTLSCNGSKRALRPA